MPEFSIGERVEAVDDTTRGIITTIEGEWITVETDDGFPHQYRASELMRVSGQERIHVSPSEAARARMEEERAEKKKPPAPRRKERQAPKMEVDLHINQLVPTTHGMSKYDILNLQLETARRQLEFAMEKRIPRIVFIHGVGEGILREELGALFRRYDNLTYYDAEYRKYGLGATEVSIFQNS